MGRACYLCKRRFEKGSTTSYHQFPSDPLERSKWFQNLGLEPVSTKSIHLCSDHFELSDFRILPLGRKHLKKYAVPVNIAVSESSESEPSMSDMSSSSSYTSIEEIIVKVEEDEDPFDDDQPIAATPSSSSSTITAPETVEHERQMEIIHEEPIFVKEIIEPPVKKFRLVSFVQPQITEPILKKTCSSVESVRSMELAVCGNGFAPPTQRIEQIFVNGVIEPAIRQIRLVSSVQPQMTRLTPEKTCCSTESVKSRESATCGNELKPPIERIRLVSPVPPQMTQLTPERTCCSTESVKYRESATCGNGLKPPIQRPKPKYARYAGDCVIEDMQMSHTAKINWNIAKNTIAALRRKVRTLQQHNRRLKARVHCLSIQLASTKSKKFEFK